MTHLSHAEFVDLIESSALLSPDRLQHVEACSECRAEADALRSMRMCVLEDTDAQPSPLFWNHFAARVADAVRHEPVPASAARWLRVPFMTWAAVGSVAVLLIATSVWRTTLHAPAPNSRQQALAPTVGAPAPVPIAAVDDDLEADEAWAVVRAAAIDLEWEDAHAAGISAHPGQLEDVARALNTEERAELARLLDEDLKRNGA